MEKPMDCLGKVHGKHPLMLSAALEAPANRSLGPGGRYPEREKEYFLMMLGRI